MDGFFFSRAALLRIKLRMGNRPPFSRAAGS